MRKMAEEFRGTEGRWWWVSCHCLVKFAASGVVLGYECQACGNTGLRFIHTIQLEETERQVQVGIECARRLVGEHEAEFVRLGENEAKRRERWRVLYRNPGRVFVDMDELIRKGKI